MPSEFVIVIRMPYDGEPMQETIYKRKYFANTYESAPIGFHNNDSLVKLFLQAYENISDNI